ncbi:MAG: hypothetical protein FJW24_03160, partial [Acidimicrobiia bacterium]|nr:hypothetical protein [Acidimicrobiia bacterium]
MTAIAGVFADFRPTASPMLPRKNEPPGKQKRGAMPKLTKRVVDALEPDPGGRDSFRWDSE